MKKKIAFITALILVTIQFTAISVIPSSAAAPGTNGYQTYYLRNAYSGKYLDLASNGTINGTEVQQYDFGYPSELFNVRVQSDGYYVIETMLVNDDIMVLDGRSNCVAGAQVILYDLVGADEQYWHFRKNEDGTYYITPSKNIYLNLAITGNSTENNAVASLAGSTYNQESQIWCLEPVEMSTYDFSYMFSNTDNDSHISCGIQVIG